MEITPERIVISRTDGIGDVALTLPLAGILKERFPGAEIIFLGRDYTLPVIRCSEHVDQVWSWDDIASSEERDAASWLRERDVDILIHVFPRKEIARWAKEAGVPVRIGTSHRLFHRFTCTHRPAFTRRRSDLHEAQLNTKLLVPLGVDREFSLSELHTYAGFTRLPKISEGLADLIEMDMDARRIILHPKTHGSGVEWGIANFMELARLLRDERYRIYITGTEPEAAFFRDQLPDQSNLTDLSGRLSLDELIAFIAIADCLVAASTGPLHIAGLCQIPTLGLYAPTKPIHPGRWRPLGGRSVVLVDEDFSAKTPLLGIDPRDVLGEIEGVVL